MPITEPGDCWAAWSSNNPDSDEATRLAALHEFIMRTAQAKIAIGDISVQWANKKLAKLGITDQIAARYAYDVQTTTTATISTTVTAASRAEALEKFKLLLAQDTWISRVTVTDPGNPEVVSGPEDTTGIPDPDAPTTVQATLEKLRETIMLGNIAGPRWDCDSGSNAVLTAYGLAPLPARKEFAVRRPAEGVLVTVVEAYDEASAARVAAWRWDNSQVGYTPQEMSPTGDPEVAERP